MKALSVLLISLAVFMGCETATFRERTDEKYYQAPSIELIKKSSGKTNWIYTSDVNKMDDSMNKFSELKSINSVNLNYPYSGKNHGTLLVRKLGNKDIDVVFYLDKGQILREYDSTTIIIRFENNPPVQLAGVVVRDIPNMLILFSGNTSVFLDGLVKSKNIKIQVPIYANGSHIFEFYSPGFIE